MLTFDDLLAARVLSKLQPRLRVELLKELADRRDVDVQQGSLLRRLVQAGRISGETGLEVMEAMARYKQGRALGIFVQLLSDEGLDRASLEAEYRALGGEATAAQLSQAAVGKGLLGQERCAQLLFQARVLFDRDMQRQLEEHLVSTPMRPGLSSSKSGEVETIESTRFNLMAQLPPMGSEIFRADVVVPVPADEAEEIIESSSDEGFSGLLKPPEFEIPDWIDTSVLVGAPLMIADYRILGRIDSGGMGTIYLAHALTDHSLRTALKVLRADAPPETVARFKREAVAASLIDHPNVLDLYEAGEDGGRHFLAMEFFDGPNLATYLEENGHLSGPDAVRLLRMLLGALDAVHKAHVVHRDIKPANLLVSRDLSDLRLMDFGVAQIQSLGGLEDRFFHTVGRKAIGTPRYMSPEQASGDPITPVSDLYSVGLVLYEMLSGSFPFEAEGPLEYLAAHRGLAPKSMSLLAPFTKTLPDGLHALVEQLLEKEPPDRPQSCAAVLAALDAIRF